jgi:alkylhydroperoxidase family enzyme
MAEFTVHSPATAPAASKPVLESTQKAFGGMIPNLYGVMAASPALVEAYQELSRIFAKTSLTATERHIVWLTINYENECTYCMAAHSLVAKGGGVAEGDVHALRTGAKLSDPKHEALRRFTSHMVRRRGWAEPDAIGAFLAAGYTQENILDVILGIGQKTLSNYTNHIANTPVDKPFMSEAWSVELKAAAGGAAG